MLEDAATILAATGLPADRTTIAAVLAALYCAIVLSDFGLYGMGRLAASTPWARRWAPAARTGGGRHWVQRHVMKLVFISRFTPGARLPAYTACGYFHADLRRFALAAITASLVWTTLLVGVGLRLGSFLATQFGAWSWVAMAGFAVAALLASRLASHTRAVWQLGRTAKHPSGRLRTIYTFSAAPDAVPDQPVNEAL